MGSLEMIALLMSLGADPTRSVRLLWDFFWDNFLLWFRLNFELRNSLFAPFLS